MPGADADAADQVDHVVAAAGAAPAQLGEHGRGPRRCRPTTGRSGPSRSVEQLAEPDVAPAPGWGRRPRSGCACRRCPGRSRPTPSTGRPSGRGAAVDRSGDQVGDLLGASGAGPGDHRTSRDSTVPADADGGRGDVGDRRRRRRPPAAAGVRPDQVRRPADALAADRHGLLDQPERGEVGDQRAHRRAADPEPLRSARPASAAPSRCTCPRIRREVVPPDGVGPRGGDGCAAVRTGRLTPAPLPPRVGATVRRSRRRAAARCR